MQMVKAVKKKKRENMLILMRVNDSTACPERRDHLFPSVPWFSGSPWLFRDTQVFFLTTGRALTSHYHFPLYLSTGWGTQGLHFFYWQRLLFQPQPSWGCSLSSQANSSSQVCNLAPLPAAFFQQRDFELTSAWNQVASLMMIHMELWPITHQKCKPQNILKALFLTS